MTDLGFGTVGAPLLTGPESTASTPLARAAGRLQAVLPPGWRVEIAVAPDEPGGRPRPLLRVVMPQD
ncbi:hypothetical protein [Nocardia noduli]|uniref:hypothetical protein n=1 Tax=Nocardia noduli TaxID=2815722 RepID=UPI001C215D2A|nr:hypothetical protein [Nocardia noduli]